MSVLCLLSRFRLCFSLVLVMSACLLSACPKQQSLKTSPDNEAVETERRRYQKLHEQHLKLQRTLEEHDATKRTLEDNLATLQWRLLEKDAQINELMERQASQQRMLDEAVVEVVRAKAKRRSLESKAEAASNMAEAEIAIKALKTQITGGEQDPEILKAEQLLKMGALEFEKENYGGALYLTSQAKGHIKIGQMRLSNRENMAPVDGEILFAQPLPLQVLKKSNLRQGPDLKHKVVTTLSKGVKVTGYSYKGQWVRIKTGDGTHGWIYQTLVGGR
ncbi:MAG: SH3 domain-containing protein [Deltaproteobacteria bacterium]|nr:MAG: SH3 domain-containing protein [Deltaproteobacteria bacterium]